MVVRANPRLIEELEIYGAQDVSKCYHCGNCSAVCPFSKEPFLFPRKSMRYLQMGLEERLKGDLEPWLCYFCGECSDQCPREAQPGETMMSVRRWLTATYDITGLGKLFYRSWRAEMGAIVLVGLLTGVGFYLYGRSQGDLGVYDGPGAFLSSGAVHTFDLVLGLLLASILLVNAGRMWWFTIGRDRRPRVPIGSYLKMVYKLPLHFLTQKRYRECTRKFPWGMHLAIFGSWVTMEVLIIFFLHNMQHGPEILWPVHVFGYLATIGLIGGTAYALVGRARKKETHYQHSHATDWIFLGLILFVATTGILQHVLHRAGSPPAANMAYVVHMMGVVPLLVVHLPFGKLAHLAYRPLAMYFSALQAEAYEREGTPAAVSQPGVA